MKRQENNGGINSILDLPEQVFRKIFRHISILELLTTVRNVDPKVRKYVDDYLHKIPYEPGNEIDLGSTIEIRWQNSSTGLISIQEFASLEDAKLATSLYTLMHESGIEVKKDPLRGYTRHSNLS